MWKTFREDWEAFRADWVDFFGELPCWVWVIVFIGLSWLILSLVAIGVFNELS